MLTRRLTTTGEDSPVATPSEPHPDDALVRRVQAGDVDAFDTLVHRHQDRIFNLCLWVIGDRDEAADAAQDAFVRAYRFLPKFRGDSSFGTWVGRIAVNVARDAATRRGRAPRPFSTFEDEEGEQFFDPPSKAPPPGDAMLRDERRQVVRRALALLPEHHRVVLVLFDLQGHAYEEVAAMLNLPLGTVKSRLNRARAALREALREDLELFDVS